MFKKETIFCHFSGMLYEKQHDSIMGKSHYQDVAYISNMLYFYFVFIWPRGMTLLPRSSLSKRNGMDKHRYKHFSHVGEKKMIPVRMYQFKLTKS